MYVRKFESETMSDAVRQIKQELGPDAIILKTRTNKGIKGAFKKNKIEITAAISEKNYSKKMKVDNIFDDSEKKRFYNNNSSYISNVIENYKNFDSDKKQKEANYSNASEKESASDLDNFLQNQEVPNKEEVKESRLDSVEKKPEFAEEETVINEIATFDKKEKIERLERKIFQLEKHFEKLNKNSPLGILQLQTTLRSLGISESYIQQLSKKILFGLSKDDLDNSDIVFEFALKEMLAQINTELPLFSNTENAKKPVVTVLISEISCGQTTILYKLGVLKKESVLIKSKNKSTFTEDIFNLNVKEATGLSNYISLTHSAVENGQSVFMDYKSIPQKAGETKRFIEGLRRSFEKVEVLICLSSVCSETYNRKIIERYAALSNGLIITKLDLCFDYGNLFNIGEAYKQLPFKFFGTGETIPEDIESATVERILSGIFQLK